MDNLYQLNPEASSGDIADALHLKISKAKGIVGAVHATRADLEPDQYTKEIVYDALLAAYDMLEEVEKLWEAYNKNDVQAKWTKKEEITT